LMFELHAEQAAGEFFQNRTGNFYAVLFTHKPPGFGWRTGQSEFRPAR
jgi:hypothetical protein